MRQKKKKKIICKNIADKNLKLQHNDKLKINLQINFVLKHQGINYLICTFDL